MSLPDRHRALFDAAYRSDWEVAREILAKGDSSQATSKHRGVTAMYWACRHNAPLDVVERTMALFPEAARTRDVGGYTPLIRACMQCSDDVVLYLIGALSDSTVKIHDHFNKSPLYWLLYKRRSPRLVDRVLRAYPEAIFVKSDLEEDTPFQLFVGQWEQKMRLGIDDDPNEKMNDVSYVTQTLNLLLRAKVRGRITEEDESWFPVHEAIKCEDLPQVFTRFLIKHNPHELYRRDSNGDLPLHALLALTSKEEILWSVLSVVLRMAPLSANVPNAQGRLPINVALMTGKRFLNRRYNKLRPSCLFSLIDDIFYTAPGVLYARDVSTHLYPALIAATRKEKKCIKARNNKNRKKEGSNKTLAKKPRADRSHLTSCTSGKPMSLLTQSNSVSSKKPSPEFLDQLDRKSVV